MSAPDSTITHLLQAICDGDRAASDQLFEAVYAELHRLAEQQLDKELAGHTLQPTALVHEAYMKLADQAMPNLNGRTHFCAIAARAMQQVLVDHARGKKRQKRGGGWRRVVLDDAFSTDGRPDIDLLAFHDAIEKLRAFDAQAAKVVELRAFSGLSYTEIAGLLDIPSRTVEREWAIGRAWLRKELMEEPDE